MGYWLPLVQSKPQCSTSPRSRNGTWGPAALNHLQLMVSSRYSCRVQLLADAAAGGRGIETVKIHEEDALETYKTIGNKLQFFLLILNLIYLLLLIGSHRAGYFSGLMEFQALEAREGVKFELNK